MFDEVQNKVVPVERAEPEVEEFDISLLNAMELLSLRARIDARLPPMTLSGLNLEKELVIQYAVAKALQQQVIDDRELDDNKKSMVVNSCTNALTRLTALQIDVHTSERFKTIEGLMIRYMRTLPKDTVDAFIADYKKLGKE